MLIPFYISLLPQEEYGILQQIVILSSFCEVFISLSIKQSMLRLYYDYNSKTEKARFLGNIILYLISSYIIAVIIFSITPLISIIFNFNEISGQFLLILLYTFLFELLYLGLTYLRIHRKLKVFLTISAIVSVSEVIIIILLLFMDYRTAMIRIYGGIIASVLGIAALVVMDRTMRFKFQICPKIFSNFFSFSIPLIAINILGWFIVSYDRILIANHMGVTILAVYGLAFQLASIYKIGQMGFLRALSVNIYERANKINFISHIHQIGNKAGFVSVTMAFLIVFLMYYISPLLVPLAYFQAIDLTILFIISKILLIYFMFNTTLMKSFKNTGTILVIYMLSSGVFYFSCKSFIPEYGMIGGVYAHIITGFILMALSQLFVYYKYLYCLSLKNFLSLIISIIFAISAVILKTEEFYLLTLMLIVTAIIIILNKGGIWELKKIIAEVGQAHDGSLGMAHSYIDAIQNSEFDSIKFQTHIASAESSKYETFRIPFSYEDVNRYDYWKRMEFTFDQWKELKTHCDEKGLEFISSPFSVKAFEYLESLDVKTYKIASGCVENLLLLDLIIQTDKKVIISTGIYGYESLDQIMQRYADFSDNISFLHCITSYPTPIDKLNLLRIQEMKDRYSAQVIGYSDHSGEIWPVIVAASLGAEILEYHITFDKKSFGPDSAASLVIEDACYVAKVVKKMNVAMNKSNISQTDKHDLKKLFGYSLSAKQKIKKDSKIRISDLETKKPAGHGIHPKNYKSIIGQKSNREILPGEFIQDQDIR